MKLLLGDCIEKMKELKANSVDTVITDPPYGLEFMGKDWDSFSNNTNSALGGQSPANIGNKVFPKRGKPIIGWCKKDKEAKYSFQKFTLDWSTEALRVAKPGATFLCFGGTRTYHRLACAVEEAGWILKDCIMWLYGSGFPKATDISKQLDKGYERKQEIEEIKQEENLFEKEKIIKKDKKGKSGKTAIWQEQGGMGNFKLTKPTTPQAKLWNGWKSHGLKPAYEPILVAMKLNEGSYAENALKHGVAGLNIDGGRIGTDITKTCIKDFSEVHGNKWGKAGAKYPTKGFKENPPGRFPANIILDEEAAKMLDEQSGESCSVKNQRGEVKNNKIFGEYNLKSTERGHNDKGGASRFFYTAKASKSERNMGCKELEKKKVSDGREKEADNAYQRGKTLRSNTHPTVKPLKLMEYLCILTKTPTGGIVLDPFMGSGTTGIACVNTDREFIGIEKEPEYMEIAKKRIEYAVQKRKERLF